jgi:gamma-butyrobetaine dioxygenase
LSKDLSKSSDNINLNDVRDVIAQRLKTEVHREKERIRKKNGSTDPESFNPTWLRDACDCSLCVDSSTKQKTFQTTDIPPDIRAANQQVLPDGSLQITWSEEVPGTGKNHVSTYSKGFLSLYRHNEVAVEELRKQKPRILWNKTIISDDITFLDYKSYMEDENTLYDALERLRIYGLVFLRGVPDDQKAVENIGGRIGPLRDSFYGRTWDVKSVPQAKNVAYTNVNLGFHMDLLYMREPPGLQMLHCLRNSCEGGSSLFTDSFHAASETLRANKADAVALKRAKTTFHYDNAGEHYRHTRPVVISDNLTGEIKEVNWSPPFQAPSTLNQGISSKTELQNFIRGVKASRALASRFEDPANIFEYRLNEGECVIFNNRRVLHARRAFDVTSGERWLKGAYVDTDVFQSRLRVLHESREGSKPFLPSSELGSTLLQEDV